MISFKDFCVPIIEGVYDMNIFKVVFIAGGPGSGKSYVADKTMGGLGLKVVNSDAVYEKKLKDAGKSLKLTADPEYMNIRARSKELTDMKKIGYIKGRLGMIIDGTGHNYNKIEKQKKELEKVGYDTYMVFVNTALEVALKRNVERERSIMTDVVIQYWNDVQKNIGKFQLLFYNKFIVVDANDKYDDGNKKVIKEITKRIRFLLNQPVENRYARKWIKDQLRQKKRT